MPNPTLQLTAAIAAATERCVRHQGDHLCSCQRESIYQRSLAFESMGSD